MEAGRQIAVLFGFDSKDKDSVGYLKVEPGGYRIVQDASNATEFRLSAEPGGASPLDWCKFFRGEPGVSDWRFHPVTLVRNS